jgi:predicted nucleic acid-binding Zn ribbon protein
MSLHSIDLIFNSVCEQPGWEGVKDWSQIVRAWTEIVNPPMAVQTRPKSCQRGVITIATESATLAHHLSFQKQILLRQLQHRLPHLALKELRFAPLGGGGATNQTISLDAEPEVDRIIDCPDCDTVTPIWEIERWGTCKFCAIDRGILG